MTKFRVAEHVHYPKVREELHERHAQRRERHTPSFIKGRRHDGPLGRREPAGGPAESSRSAC